MRSHRQRTPLARRPLSALAAPLVLGSALHALVAGCGGRSQPESTTESAAPPAATSPAPGPAADTAAAGGDVALGQRIYQQRCVLCHGPQGKGDGPGAAGLNPKPRNHTDGAYMRARTDQELLEVIGNGKGQMPAWGKTGVLSEPEMRAVLAYIRTLAR